MRRSKASKRKKIEMYKMKEVVFHMNATTAVSLFQIFCNFKHCVFYICFNFSLCVISPRFWILMWWVLIIQLLTDVKIRDLINIRVGLYGEIRETRVLFPIEYSLSFIFGFLKYRNIFLLISTPLHLPTIN